MGVVQQEGGGDKPLHPLHRRDDLQLRGVVDYERFFAEKLTEAQYVIHITMSKNVSQGYQNALEAAKSFENVTVVDSGHLSSGMGLPRQTLDILEFFLIQAGIGDDQNAPVDGPRLLEPLGPGSRTGRRKRPSPLRYSQKSLEPWKLQGFFAALGGQAAPFTLSPPTGPERLPGCGGPPENPVFAVWENPPTSMLPTTIRPFLIARTGWSSSASQRTCIRLESSPDWRIIWVFGISVCPYYICTDEGRFLDRQELNPDELLAHIALPALAVRATTGTSSHSPPGWTRRACRHSIPSISGIRWSIKIQS